MANIHSLALLYRISLPVPFYCYDVWIRREHRDIVQTLDRTFARHRCSSCVLYVARKKIPFAKLPIDSHVFISFACHYSIRLIFLARSFSILILPFAEYVRFGARSVHSSGRHLFTLQQIDLPILGMKSKLVNNEIVTQATNSMCKVTLFWSDEKKIGFWLCVPVYVRLHRIA